MADAAIADATGMKKIHMPLSAPNEMARYIKNNTTDKRETPAAVVKRMENKLFCLHFTTNTIQKIKMPGSETNAEQSNTKPTNSNPSPLLVKVKMSANSKPLMMFAAIHIERLINAVITYLFDPAIIFLLMII